MKLGQKMPANVNEQQCLQVDSDAHVLIFLVVTVCLCMYGKYAIEYCVCLL